MERLSDTECVRDVSAQIFSVGGAVIFSVCVILSVILFISFDIATVSATQRIISVLLVLASWAYLISSATEHLSIDGNVIEFSAFLTGRRRIQIKDLESMLLIHQGLNLEKGIETIEFRRKGKKPERLALGPCWRRHKLEEFLHSVEEALNAPRLLEEVR